MTSIEWFVAVSKSIAPATVTSPVFGSIANRPPASSLKLYVTPLFEPSASDAKAVMPTDVPIALFSLIAFVVSSVSEIAETSNSSWSLTLMV